MHTSNYFRAAVPMVVLHLFSRMIYQIFAKIAFGDRKQEKSRQCSCISPVAARRNPWMSVSL